MLNRYPKDIFGVVKQQEEEDNKNARMIFLRHHHQRIQEDKKQETNLAVRVLGAEHGRLPSSLGPRPGTPGMPPSSSSGGWGSHCLGTAEGPGGTGGLQGIFASMGWNIASLRTGELSECAAEHSGAMGLSLVLERGKTTGPVATTCFLTNQSGGILEEQQGLATPSATSQGNTNHHRIFPAGQEAPEGLKRSRRSEIQFD